MSCERWQELIQDRCDDDLRGADGVALDRHLASCPPCRAYANELRFVVEGLTELRGLSTLDALDNHIEIPRPWRRTVMRWSRVKIAAAVGLLLLGGVLLRARWYQPSYPDIFVANVGQESHTPRHSRNTFTPIVTLEDKSAERFIPVRAKTNDPRVHLIWLHKIAHVSTQASDESGDRTSETNSAGAGLIATFGGDSEGKRKTPSTSRPRLGSTVVQQVRAAATDVYDLV